MKYIIRSMALIVIFLGYQQIYSTRFARWAHLGRSIEGFFLGRSPYKRYRGSYQSSRIGNQIIAQGALYELNVIEYLLKNDHIVCSVCQKKECKHNLVKREFDIETDEQLIECKDINWRYVSGAKSSSIKQQIVEQQIIAEHHGKQFVIYSRKPLSAQWEKWFAKKGILVFIVDA